MTRPAAKTSSSRPVRRLLAGCMLTVCLATPAGAATVRIGLLVGNDIGLASEAALEYAEADARRVRDLIEELGGFEAERIELLLGKGSAELINALYKLRGRIAEVEARGDDALLFFYYSGHGDKGHLHLGNSKMGLSSLRKELAATGATVVVGIIDACHSGSIGRAKGGVPAAAFDVTLLDEPTPRGMVLISSSMGDELAQESPELRGSLFTHYLLSALRGAADYDADGRVTIREAYRSAYHRTLSRSVTTSSRRQHPFADIDMSGKGELTMTFLHKSSAAIRLGAKSAGRYMIVESHSGDVVAELHKESGREVRISLPAGSYKIYKQETDEYLVCGVNLLWGGEHEVDEHDMQRRSYRLVAEKGLSGKLLQNRLSLHTEAVDGLLPGMNVWAAGGVGYRRFLLGGLSLGISLAYTHQRYTFEPGGEYLPLDVSHHELRTRLQLAYRFESLRVLPWLSPCLGVLFEYLYGWQEQNVPDEPDYSFDGSFHMLGTGVQLGFEIGLPGRWSLDLWGRGMLAWTVLAYNEVERTRFLELIANPSKSRQNILFWAAGLAVGWNF